MHIHSFICHYVSFIKVLIYTNEEGQPDKLWESLWLFILANKSKEVNVNTSLT